MTKHTFTTPVSMEVTQKQYSDDLKGPLLELGYNEYHVTDWRDYEYLVTNINNTIGMLGNLSSSYIRDNNRYFIDHYNPDLFLALAAITDSSTPIVGEYWHWEGSDSRKFLKCSSLNGSFNDCYDFSVEGKSGYDSCHLINLTKATKQELINQFTKSNSNTDMSNNNNKKIFPLQLSPQNAQRIIDIACTTWTAKLAKSWGADIVQNKTIDIHQDDYENMRSACTTEQNTLFDEIFGSDKPVSKNAIITDIADQIKDRASLVTVCKNACNDINRADLQNKSLWVRNRVEIIIHEDGLRGGKILEFKLKY